VILALTGAATTVNRWRRRQAGRERVLRGEIVIGHSKASS